MLYSNKPLFAIEPKTFSCVCFVHILPSMKDKLSAKALKCVFLGYSRLQKGYVCYNPSLKKTYISMDVSFFENISFYSQSVLSHPLQSRNPTSTPLVPFPVVDFPKQPAPRFADPPIDYSRRPHDYVIADHPLPSLPVLQTPLLSIPADLRMTPSLLQTYPLLLLLNQV